MSKASPSQVAEEHLAQLNEFDSVTALARAMHEKNPDLFGNVENARGFLRRARLRAMKAARKDPRPPESIEDYRIEEGFKAKGRSSYYGKDGKLVGTWLIEREDSEKQREIFQEGIAALVEEMPRLAPIEAPKQGTESLCNLFTLTDCHLGMMASASEAGESWGLEKGERKIGEGFDWLITGAPPAKKCVISQLGDFIHSEGLESLTSRSKHSLDQDARLGDVVRAAIRLLRRVVDSALATHQEVELVIAEGNHDEAASLLLRESFRALYEHEQRLRVLDGLGGGDLPFYETTHGETMLGFHHGHIRNVKSKGAAQGLALLFADGEAWRTTRKRYIHTGHHHDEALIEVTGAKCFAHPSFIVPDAYASRNFGGAMRHMTAHTYHDKHGKVGESTVTPEMIA